MIVLGLSVSTHDTSAALIKDGKILSLIEEERLNRQKHTQSFPWLAIENVIIQNQINPSEIDIVVFSWNPVKEIFNNLGHVARFFPESLHLLSKKNTQNGAATPFKKIIEINNFRRLFNEKFKTQSQFKIKIVDHHLAHAATTFYNSGFPSGEILVVDGRGESQTTTWWTGHNHHGITKVKEIKVPHSLGHFYTALTDYLGFKAFSDEWKVMGLSSYGTSDLVALLKPWIILSESFSYKLNLNKFSFHVYGRQKWLSNEGQAELDHIRSRYKDDFQFKADLAFAAQKSIEKVALHLLQTVKKKSPTAPIMLGGGVALNCVMNSYLHKMAEVEQFYVPPFPHDAGNSLGAAQYIYHQITGQTPEKLNSVYLGTKNDSNEIENFLKKNNIQFKRIKDIESLVAQKISEGQIVGWYQGSAEAGPRALGNRSLIADPRCLKTKERINIITKKREAFRPFAPSFLEDQVHDIVDLPLKSNSPYMIKTGFAKKEWITKIPAVVHVDGTVRVQSVNYQDNPRFYNLISEFYKITGVPAVLNTSFNENEPIVNTPEQAWNCFLRTDLDLLVLGDYLIEKSHL